MSRPPCIVLAGFFVRYPLGGYVWQTLHYLLGLRDLGADVYFYEDSDYYPHAYDPIVGSMDTRFDYGVARLAETLDRFDLGDRWVFWDAQRDVHHGLSAAGTRALFERASVFVNLGGVNRMGKHRRPPACLYVDIDPAYTQICFERGVLGAATAITDYDFFYTVGENIGSDRSPLPTSGISWRPTRPPVVGRLWANARTPRDGAFTTVGKWDSAGRDLSFRGETYAWRKALEFEKIVDLPRRSGETFELAMDVDAVPDDAARFRAAGWRIRNPLEISLDPDAYRRYLQGSKGELTAAKDMNVRLRSGWFSDRSVCYLAAGRPAILQDTGFSDYLPTGRGLHAFRSVDQAAESVARVCGDWDSESRRAREIAEECFEARRVLAPWLEAAGCGRAQVG